MGVISPLASDEGDWISPSGINEGGTPQIRDGTQMKTEEKDKLSYGLVGYAMAVHSEIGPGLDESFYHQFMYERARLTVWRH